MNGSSIIYYDVIHFIAQPEFHGGTLILCPEAEELTLDTHSLDSVDNHHWLLSFILHLAFIVNTSCGVLKIPLCHMNIKMSAAAKRQQWLLMSNSMAFCIFRPLPKICWFLSVFCQSLFPMCLCSVLWSDVSQELSLSTKPIWSTAPASGCN